MVRQGRWRAANLLLNREEVLLDVVLHHLTDKLLSNIRIGVLEASSLDSGAINREGVVVQQLGVEVRGERSAGDAGSSAHLTPGLQVLVVDILDDILEVKTSGVAHDGAIEAGRNAKDGLKDLVDLGLISVVLIGKVVEGADRNVAGAVPHGSGNIAHVDSAQTEIARPHELHLLLEVLVNSSADETRGDAAHVTRAVDGRGTKDNKRKTLHGLEVSLSLEVSLGEHGPGVSLVTLLGRLLASGVDLSSAQVHELLDGVLHSLGGNLDADVMELLLIDLLS